MHTPTALRRSLLELRERLLGPGAVLSPSRFLYHTVGPVYLIRWSQEGGHSVLPLDSSQLEEHLKLDVEALRSQPLRLAQVRVWVRVAYGVWERGMCCLTVCAVLVRGLDHQT